MTPFDYTLFLYNLTLIPVIFFSLLFSILALLSLLGVKRGVRRFKPLRRTPFVSVQVPTFNDPIAARCVEHCLKFDYPKEKYEVIIVDDSTNPATRSLLKSFEERYPGRVRYVHRDRRTGFKPGALKEAMPVTRGEFIVIFDADWIPKPDFLKKVLRPFSDPSVAIVQTRQGFYNHKKNLISRFASYLLMIHHAVIMPLNNRINCVFFCGTAGALRRSAFEEAGGWNLESITEDSDLSVKLILKGWKTVYLEYETPSEVPETLESFIKQQMRWCYGNARVFFDHAREILFNKALKPSQRLMMLYLTTGNIVAVAVVAMTIFGFAGWFLGDPKLFTLGDVITLVSRVLFTAGFFILGGVALHRWGELRQELKYLLLSGFSLGIILAVANSVAFVRAAAKKGLYWYCTPKSDNEKAL